MLFPPLTKEMALTKIPFDNLPTTKRTILKEPEEAYTEFLEFKKNL